MMTSVMEILEQEQRPYRTRSEGAQLLEELRAAHCALATEDRRLINCQVAKLARLQAELEGK